MKTHSRHRRSVWSRRKISFLLGLLALMSARVRFATAAESDAEHKIQEEFRLGEADWKRSCAKPSEDGACVKVTPAAGRARCGAATAAAPAITVIARDKRRAASAKQHFESAIKLWKEGNQQSEGTPTAIAATGAFFYLAEVDYENLLRQAAPTDLDFSPAPDTGTAKQLEAARARSLDSQKRFSAYLAEKSKALATAREGYLAIFKLRRSPWNVASAARIGQSYQGFAQQLQSMSIPKDMIGKADAREVYCRALDEKAGPIMEKAIEAFEMCIGTANENDTRGSWSELCERELGRLKAARPSPASEPRAE